MPQTWAKVGSVGRTTAVGSAAVPALAAGASATVNVTLDRAMPSAAYRAQATISGTTALLAVVQVVGVVKASQTATVCPVRVRASGVLALGATVDVIAVA